MKTITVNVTASDIAAGSRLDAAKCPLALAATRAFGKNMHVMSSWMHEESKCMTYTYQFRLPEDVHQFVLDFDTRKLVQPSSFQIEVPE